MGDALELQHLDWCNYSSLLSALHRNRNYCQSFDCKSKKIGYYAKRSNSSCRISTLWSPQCFNNFHLSFTFLYLIWLFHRRSFFTTIRPLIKLQCSSKSFASFADGESLAFYIFLCYGFTWNWLWIWAYGGYILLCSRLVWRKIIDFLWNLYWWLKSQNHYFNFTLCSFTTFSQPRWYILARILRLFHEQHSFYSVGSPWALFFCACVSIFWDDKCYPPIYKGISTSDYQILPD